jgi:hypothetical protein
MDDERIVGRPAASVCPSCGTPMAADAVLCIECGHHLHTGERVKTRRKRLRRVWETPTLATRLVITGCMLAGMLFALLYKGPNPVSLSVAGIFTLVVVLAMSPLGLTTRLALQRDRRGRLLFRKTRRLFFIAFEDVTVDVGKYQKAYTDATPDTEDSGGVVSLTLVGEQCSPVVVYRGQDEQLMKELADAFRELAGLRLERK